MWKKHPTLPIEVSSLGEVRGERQRKGSLISTGYRRIAIDGKSYYLQVLVLETFKGPRPPKKQARFKDGNNGNCSLSNLYWGDPAASDKKAPKIAMSRGRIASQLKITMAEAKRLSVMVGYGFTPQQVAVKFGVSLTRAQDWIEAVKKEVP